MPNSQINHIITEFKTFTLSDQLILLEEMASLIRRRSEPAKLRQISEIRGRGKELWRGIDVKNYIDGERNSWNG